MANEGRFIEWTRDCVKVVPMLGGGMGELILLPGVNYVSPEDWKAVEGILAPDLKSGRVILVETKGEGGKSVPAGSLKDLKPNEAKEVIKKINAPETLKQLKAQETREEVRLDLRQREDEIEAELNRGVKDGKAK